MASDLTLSLAFSSDLPQTRGQQLARDLANDLRRVGVAVEPTKSESEAGSKGLLEDFARLLIGDVGEQAIKGVFDILKAYIVREKRLIFKLTMANGQTLEIDATNIASCDVTAFIAAAASRA